MSDEFHPEDRVLIPRDADRRLSLPADLIHRGLELARRIEQQQGIQKVDEPILKFPGVLPRSCITFSRDGKFAAIATHGRQKYNPGLVIWHVVSRVLSVFPEAGFKNAAPALFFVQLIPSDEQMGVTKETSAISEIRMSATEARYKPIGHPDSAPRHIHSLALSSHGDVALIGYGDGTVLRCRIQDHAIRPLGVIARNAQGRAITALSFSPDDQLFAECSEQEVRIRDAATGQEMRRISGYNPYYNQVAFSHHGRKLLMAGCREYGRGSEGGMALVDLYNRQPPVLFRKRGLVQASAVSLFPDGERAVSLGEGGTVTIWNARTGQEISNWRHTEADVGDLIHEKRLPNNLRLEMKNPIIWGLSSVAVSPDGRRILSGGGDTFLRLWTPSGQMIREYPHDSRVVKVAFTPDGQHALAGGWNGSVWVWQLP